MKKRAKEHLAVKQQGDGKLVGEKNCNYFESQRASEKMSSKENVEVVTKENYTAESKGSKQRIKWQGKERNFKGNA
jgi:hypothetical protein